MEENVAPDSLHPTTVDRVRATKLGISLDWWAVIVAIVLAALVRMNWLSIGWDSIKF